MAAQKTHTLRNIAILLILVIVVILNYDRINVIRSDPIDRTDYQEVGTRFLTANGFIANKLGKVTRVSHIGKGGGGGKESYNVFRLVGTDRSGIINMTLTKNDEGKWYVSACELTTSGSTYEVPVSRSAGDKWRLFKWNSN